MQKSAGRRRQWPHRLIVSVLMLGGAAFFLQPVVANFLNARASAERASEYVSTVAEVSDAQLAESRLEAEAYNEQLTPEVMHDP